MNTAKATQWNIPAFSLVELLVVVTVIMALLALLTPALDRAVYMAELTACGAQLRAVAGAAVTYAAAERRSYPARKMISDQPGTLVLQNKDDRPIMRSLFGGLRPLVDPLTGRLDLDLAPSNGTYVRTAYQLWFGWRYIKAGEKGMHRLGDSFTWTYTGTGGASYSQAFNVLATDWDYVAIPSGAGRTISSHADREGRMELERYENEPVNQVGAVAPGAPGGALWTAIRWVYAPARRPPIDLNYAFDDLSVLRLDELDWEEASEPRTVAVPVYADQQGWTGPGAGEQTFIPPAR